MSKFKHLDLDDRIIIEQSLKVSCSFKAIAKELGKHCTSVSKEVKNHIMVKQTGYLGRAFNNCQYRFSCKKSYICQSESCHHKNCKFCSICSKVCKDYVKETCKLLDKPPYVCNGCDSLNKCSLEKSFYSASYAQKEYELMRSESRSGVNTDENTIKYLDKLISSLILKGQSIHHIYVTNRDAIMCCEKTIYNYIDYKLFLARNIDLTRKVKFRPRKKTYRCFKVDKNCRVGRTYDDFQAFMKENPDTPVVEMDTVEGVKGGKVLLTLHFLEAQFMPAFLRDANTSQSVINVFNVLYEKLGTTTFQRLFPVILTDNGSEFTNPLKLEFDDQNIRRTRIFYCDKSAPQQKGSLENNHEFIQRIVPKGNSFDSFTQDDINLMMNHINSYRRRKLNDQSPISVFSFLNGEEILEKFGVNHIPDAEITLRPALLKR